MEHRCSGRIVTDLSILLYKEKAPVAIGRIQNGSTRGFFIEADFSNINFLQPLELEILLHRNSPDLTRHRYITRIIRITETGLGVGFELKNVESAKALEDLLHSPHYWQRLAGTRQKNGSGHKKFRG